MLVGCGPKPPVPDPRPHDSSPHCELKNYIELKRFWHEIAALNENRLRKEAFQLMEHFHL